MVLTGILCLVHDIHIFCQEQSQSTMMLLLLFPTSHRHTYAMDQLVKYDFEQVHTYQDIS